MAIVLAYCFCWTMFFFVFLFFLNEGVTIRGLNNCYEGF